MPLFCSFQFFELRHDPCAIQTHFQSFLKIVLGFSVPTLVFQSVEHFRMGHIDGEGFLEEPYDVINPKLTFWVHEFYLGFIVY